MGKWAVVQNKDLNDCWCAFRYTVGCEHCARVENCKLPEAAKGRLVLAEKALAYWQEKAKHEIERAQALVEARKKELEGGD